VEIKKFKTIAQMINFYKMQGLEIPAKIVDPLNELGLQDEEKEYGSIISKITDYAEFTEDIILFDWFSGTTKIDEAEDIIRYLGLDDLEFTELYGRYGYKKRLHYDGINIYYDGHKKEMGVLLELSGQGCRNWETFGSGDYENLFEKFNNENHNITRIDIAYDDHTGTLDIKQIADLTKNDLYIAKAIKKQIIEGSDGICVYIGSKSSDTRIRFYDKALERGLENKHWVRCELQLRRDRAVNFILNNKPLGIKFGGVLNNYLRFVVENKNDMEHKHRWETQKWWLDFVNTAEKISIFTKKDIDYNLHSVEKFIYTQGGNSIETIIQCVGVEEFLNKVFSRDTKMTARYKRIIEEYKRREKMGKGGANDEISNIIDD
jgi:phage replication initiation protein